MRSTKRSTPRFRVGDWICFLYGAERVRAQVIEDRGPLGIRGRRIYRIRLTLPYSEPTEFEVAEDQVDAAAAPEPNEP